MKRACDELLPARPYHLFLFLFLEVGVIYNYFPSARKYYLWLKVIPRMSASTSEKPKEEPTVKKDEGKKNSEDKNWKGGEVVWAKVPGFNYWPGKVCSR